jgi:enoyl-CoA hydratase
MGVDLENVRFAVADGIATATIDRPKVLNALDRRTLAELSEVVDRVRTDSAARVLILTGAGEKAFVAGADIKELASNSPIESNEHARMGQALMDRLEGLGKPSIAAINGFALGGGLELALACTIRIDSRNAKLGLPEITLGVIPGFGGTQRLPRVVGKGRALHMILSGAPIDAQTALGYGLVSQVTEPEQLMNAARELAAKLAGYSAFTLRLAEETVRLGGEMSLQQGLAYEASQFGLATAAQDYREGMGAFLEKRKPAFKGR